MSLVVDLSVPLKEARDQLTAAFEKAYLVEALRQPGGNVTRAAEIAKVHRKLVHRAIRRHRLRSDCEE
jgi:transcriptional regulator of acetoin/glycerol metabolism